MLPALIQKYYNEPLYRNSIALMLNTASGAVLGLVFWIVAARTISSTNIGLATAVISLVTLITTLSQLGMDNGLIRFLPMSRNKDELYSTVITITFVITLIITAILLIGLNVFSPPLLFLRYGVYPLILILYMALASVYGMLNTTVIALRRGDLYLLQTIITGMRIPLLLILATFGVMGIISAIEIAYFVTFITGIYFISRLGVKFRPTINIGSLKEIFSFSLGTYTADILSTAPTAIIPIIIVNTVGAIDNAYFYVAYAVAALLLTIPGAVSMSLFVEGSHDLPLKENVIKSIKFTMIILIPSIIITVLFGNYILLIFNREFSDQSFELLRLLAISSLFSAVNAIYITIKRVQKNTKIINYINLLSLILLTGMGYLLLLKYGLLGIGYAWLISNMLICAGVVLLSIKYDKFLRAEA
jgi:O-antigen/teichoic acid export membrane protein